MVTDAVPVLPIDEAPGASRRRRRPGAVRRIGRRIGRRLLQRLGINEGIAFGILIGTTLAVVGIAVVNEVAGLRQLTIWEHSFESRRIDRIRQIMEHQLALADGALADGEPLELSTYLADDYVGELYQHHMDFAAHLLASGQVERFNSLRESSGFMTFDLTHRDLSGLDLGGAALKGVDLSGADLRGSDLSGADLSYARLIKTDLSDALLDGTDLSQADLTNAVLNRVSGLAPLFRDAVMVRTSMVAITSMMGARFDHATLASANLCGSALPGAVLDHADMSMASAVGADLGNVASMADVDLSGANLGNARLSPHMMARAWLVNARGLNESTIAALRRNGAVMQPREILDLVDGRIVAGFRTQIEQDGTINESLQPITLINMLKAYYQQ